MLKLSTKGRYGLRAMIELARAYGKDPVMMSSITECQNISRKYLHALLTSLKNAGLVKSVRGAKGGFVLSKKPEKIKISQICEALEGKISVVECITNKSYCSRTNFCDTRPLWQQVNKAILDVLKNVTLDDFIEPPTQGKQKTIAACLDNKAQKNKIT